MALRESQKRASLKWGKENMTVLSCKIRKEQAIAFKAHCESQGSTSNTVLKDFVLGCIGEQEPGAVPVGVLPPATLAAAQAAAEAMGEAVPQFLARAVDAQAQRDKSSLASGINPATGDKIAKE